MNTERFEDRLLSSLKDHIQERNLRSPAGEAVAVRPARSRWARGVPMVVAAAAVAVALGGVLESGQSAAPAADGGQTRSATGGARVDRITNAAYTLERVAHGEVKLTVFDSRTGTVPVDDMRRDLARMGMSVKVMVGMPSCPRSDLVYWGTKSSSRVPFRFGNTENGKWIAYVNAALIPAGDTLVLGFSPRGTKTLGVISLSMVRGDGARCVATAAPGTASSR
ncbi:hypothetical protein [Actinacidiphila paucisporea]|uniref:Uncharacterized protein n=1 Tax=Actinacidiphila paucisporea TaxID=310782 RepID=A0A1M7L3H2_9ACTN|nr:hypothetical protein [Actinacidiphila paucisporea]SHM72622.1 hypothetical protein SAMN05216499_113185 [Actinacidiphila paucisporea]